MSGCLDVKLLTEQAKCIQNSLKIDLRAILEFTMQKGFARSMSMQAKDKVTMITFDQTRNDIAQCTTYNKKLIRKLDTLCATRDDVACVNEDGEKKTYKFPRGFVKITAPKELTEETKRALAERMRKYHKAQKEQDNG